VHGVERLALDELVGLPLARHVEVFVRHPALRGADGFLEMIVVDETAPAAS